MKAASTAFSLLLVTITLPLAPIAQAQITAAPNDASTIVTQTGNTFSITGGRQAGANLFHSFQQFGLTAEQAAAFQSNPAIQNILGRVVGGDPSVIHGLIRVTGGNSNLYLMNPAGIVFGATARLDVPGSFTATTANGIGIGDRWFRASGSNEYGLLTGTPDRFAFSSLQPGAILNAGNLTVGQGQTLTLLGGTVISTGTLAAPGGTITIAAVPGEKLVRISQSGSLLSLDLPLVDKAAVASTLPSPRSLPELLTGSEKLGATGVTVDAGGVVRLTASQTEIGSGDVAVQSAVAKTATLSASQRLTLVESQLSTSGDLNLLAQTVQIRDSLTQPATIQAGGTLTVQGNQTIDLSILNHPASALGSGGDMVLRSSTLITGDARYFVGGSLRFEQPDGSAGNVRSPNDPVILALGDVTLGDYEGESLHILAGGSVTLGNVVITGTGNLGSTINPINPTPLNGSRALRSLAKVTRADGSTLTYGGTPALDSSGAIVWNNPTELEINGLTSPTLDVRAGIDWAQLGGLSANGILPAPLPNNAPGGSQPSFGNPSSANITTGRIIVQQQPATVLLTNQYYPNTALSGGAIRVDANPIDDTPSIVFSFTGPGQVVAIDSRSSVTIGPLNARGYPLLRGNSFGTGDGKSIFSGGGDIDIRAVGNIITGDLSAGGQNLSSSRTRLVSTNGNIVVTTIEAGANGVDIQTPGVFQAIGAYAASGSIGSSFRTLRTDPDLARYVRAKLGLPENATFTDAELDQVWNITSTQPLVSILARPTSGRPEGALNAPVRIQHGSGTRTDTRSFAVYPTANPTGVPRTVGVITIQGDAAFYGGPQIEKLANTNEPYVRTSFGPPVTYQEVPATNDLTQLRTFVNAYNQRYSLLPFGVSSFPDSSSGTVGAIVIGGGTNGELHGSIQDRIFSAVPQPTTPGGGAGSPGVTLSNEVGQTLQVQLTRPEQGTVCEQGDSPIASGSQPTEQPIEVPQASRGRSATAGNSCTGTSTENEQILKLLQE